MHLADHVGQTRPGPRTAPVLHLRPGVCVGDLEVVQLLDAVVGDQPIAAQRPEPARRLLVREPLADHLVAHHVRDPQARGAGAVDDHPLVAHPGAGRAYRGERGGEHHRRGALHVVVEGATLIGVAVQDPPGVGRPEVLPVQHRPREQPAHRVDVGVDQRVVALPAHSRVPLAQVHLVVEQRQVVRPRVQDHRQHPARVDPRGGGVDRELADRDLDPAHALVPDPEDALGVRGHQQVNVLGAQPGVAQRDLDLLRMIHRQVHPAAGAAELVGEPLDRQPDGRGVDHRQHLLDVLGQQPVEQHLVAIPQVRQVHPLPQIARLLAVLGVGPAQLPVQRGHPGREQPGQPQLAALLQRERRPPVDRWHGQHRHTPGGDPRDVAVGRLDQFVGSLGHQRAPVTSSWAGRGR